jgi:hypothetical protein
MLSSNDLRAELLAAARNASENATYLVGFPEDVAAKAQLLATAITIRTISGELGLIEIADLGEFVVASAKRDLTPALAVSNVNRAISRIVEIVGALGQDRFLASRKAS